LFNTSLDKIDDKNAILTLKKPNQVYRDMYKQALSRAKQSKKEAIQAFMEAKNIKKTYMLADDNDDDDDDDDDFNDDDDDDDDDIDIDAEVLE